MTNQYRQGDVFLEQISELPESAKLETQPNRIVLAWGEVTGHSHSVSTTEARLFSDQNQNYLVVKDMAHLVHEEHLTIPLPAGIYRVVRQKEYEPEFGTVFVYD
jgi:GTP cyclohydrolase I